MTSEPEFVADLHLHSRYAYACSKHLTLNNIAAAARVKGIDLLSTGDFTHPAWLAELEENLVPAGDGAFRYGGARFVLGTEVSCVYRQGGRGRRLHVLLFLPSLESVRRLNVALEQRGAKLAGDGRPTLGMSAPALTSLALDIDPQAIVIPAHLWTPWYGALGSKSGFDSLAECFRDLTPHIAAVETGLSSDPAMNWAVPGLEGRAIVSFSDAHSLPNLAREVTAFRGEPTYAGLKAALEGNRIAYTVEFYPEEGKYHFDGHRNCGVSRAPAQTRESGERCPVCGRALTLGVLHRVEALSGADLPQDPAKNPAKNPAQDTDSSGFVRSVDDRPPFLRLLPLEELLAAVLGVGRRSKTVQTQYARLCRELGSELNVLARAGRADLSAVAGERVAQAVLNARTGRVSVEPGFDGQYGRVRVLGAPPEPAAFLL